MAEEAPPPADLSERIQRLRDTVNGAVPTVCPERALLYTAEHRRVEARGAPALLQNAEALAHVLADKTVRIHPDERLVGNFTSKRLGGLIAPELHGILSLVELHTFATRKENPLQVEPGDVRRLQRLIPYWATRNLAYLAHRSPLQKARFIAESVFARDWVINEVGGIAHFAPDYARLLSQGTEGISAEARERQADTPRDSEPWVFYEAVCCVAEALARFGERYAALAERLAADEGDPQRRAELEAIGTACHRVPRRGARSFHEALQSLILAQIALVNEGLEVTICPGRLDQILIPYYRTDVAQGRFTPAEAKELLACLVIKLSEVIPAFAGLLNRMFSGLPMYQTVVVGGVDRDGQDAVNEVSTLLLDVVDALRMRQPNFHARLHAGSPQAYVERIHRMLADGANTPALYNDEIIVPTLVRYGHTLQDARDYAPIGCVEPTCQAKSFASTDAVLFNGPAVLELALNGGRRFGGRRRVGARTPSASALRSMAEVTSAFSTQLEHRLATLRRDLQAVERANAAHKPTPLSSALIQGCLATGRDVTAGGAIYNRSGIQCVGVSDVGDSLRVIEQVVYTEHRFSLAELVDQLARNLPEASVVARLRRVVRFGNDDEAADRWTAFVVREFARRVESLGESTRGGRYVAGLYSTTAHDQFGRRTGALPNGRRRGEPFTSGIAPANGADRLGPTAVIQSMSRIDFSQCPNGINFNFKLQAHVAEAERRRDLLHTLVDVYFSQGGMQIQPNVLDADRLRRARADPSLYPNLLVRVSGYSAYFNDLNDAMKDEIIARTSNELE